MVAMNPTTAVAFILASIALWLEAVGVRHQGVVAFLGAIVVSIGMIKLAGIAFHLAAGVDQILFAGRLDAEPVPNRMAPNTALGFVLLGLALLLAGLGARRGRLLSQVLALTVAWLALLAIVGYAYRAARLYGVGTYIPMAAHTATAFLLLSIGILLARAGSGLMTVITSDSPTGAMARRLVPVAALVPVVLGWLWIAGAQRRWYPDMGITPVVLANTLIFTALLWWQLSMLQRTDALRRRAEIEIQCKNRALEQTARSEREAHEALKQTQSQLVQSEKLAGLGQMVAGVAHEINNPLAFVSNNFVVLQRDVRGLSELVAFFRQLDSAPADQRPGLRSKLRESAEHIDLDYILSNLPDVLSRSREGLRRIQQIVKDLRDFARLDESEIQEADLNAGIASTVNIIEGHAKRKGVTIETRLAPLPPVRCHPAKINQVVMNLLGNAIDASSAGSTVSVESSANGNGVSIAVSDAGCGIDPSIRGRIFDPFFTTKPVGEGTGLGLSISYGIVRDHGGEISVDSTPGRGSCFTIRLPVHGRHAG
jgi:signal transduction histidine kinase